MAEKTAITPTREADFPEWYQQVITVADLAENSLVRGCMVIKPWGYGIWENIQEQLGRRIKDEGVQNAYFPLLIPVSLLAKEAEHIDGFAKECAVVTHHRLEKDEVNGGLKPAGPLTEPYVIRPTSETIIGESFSNWVQSYRDLPLKINQWCNVMRWEMRTRMFLRTAEFLWQEGHNAFATAEEANADARRMLEVYAEFAENVMAIPVIRGEKTADERFPGAQNTYTIEAMMQDGKSLQAGTSHDLGQTFAKSANIQFQSEQGQMELAHTTSWGMSTRTIGGVIMVHGDDDGLRLPPGLAPTQIIILPMLKDDDTKAAIMAACETLEKRLKAKGLRVAIDRKEGRFGDKIWGWIKKGVPLRVEIGGREAEAGQITVTRRDLGRDSKQTISADEMVDNADAMLTAIHKNMFEQAKAFRDANITTVETASDIGKFYAKKANKGFVRAPVSVLDEELFQKIAKEHALTPRCIPFEDEGRMVLIGKSY